MAGTWFRHVPAGFDAYHRPPEPADNRWQRGEVVDALYFADSEETVWAEWYRFLAEAGLPPGRRSRAISGVGGSSCPRSPTSATTAGSPAPAFRR